MNTNEQSLFMKTKNNIEKKIINDTIKNFDIFQKCFLILDTKGAKIIDIYFSFSEIINKGIFSIEYIYKKRKAFPNYSAIYLISNSSIHLVQKDFEEKNKMYKNCHLFIIDEIKDDSFDIMCEKYFLSHIKSLNQMNLEYTVLDKNIFSYGDYLNYNSIYNLFSKDNEINNINITKLFNLCQVLNIYPNISYFNLDKNCKILAEEINKKLKNFYLNKEKSGILLITSRLIDLTGPIQFNLIYQNILFELLKNRDTQNYNKVNLANKTYILNYKDELYNKYKNLYLYKVMNLIHEDFTNFKNSDIGKAFVSVKNGKNNKNEMISAIKNFDKFNSFSKNITKHQNLMLKIKEIQNERKIMEILDIQSTIISKSNENGKQISESDIISIIKKNKDNFRTIDFIRLLCLIKYYYPKINMDKIYNNLNKVKITSNEKNVINFISQEKIFGNINIDKLIQLNEDIISYRKKNSYSIDDKNNLDDKRFNFIKEAKLTTICDMASKNKLPEKFFNFVEKPINLNLGDKKKYKINLINDNYNSECEEIQKQNLILFNIGGLSNYEISSLERGVYLEQYNMNLIMGSNKIYNYKEYFQEIKNYLNGKNDIEIQKEKNESKELENDEGEVREVKIDIINSDISMERKSSDKLKKMINDKEDSLSIDK